MPEKVDRITGSTAAGTLTGPVVDPVVETVCGTADETRALARALGTGLSGGDVVVLSGPLGAGKTTFVQGLALGLGVTAPVTSPTFVLARHQRPDPRGPRPDGPDLVHVDAYRLDGALELDDLDLDSDLDSSVVVVEWGEGLAERLSPVRVEVHLDRATGTVATAAVRTAAVRAVDATDDRATDDDALDDGGTGDEPRTVRVRLVGADPVRAERLSSVMRGVPC